jgi:putative hydrolase of the HAD superfamily
MVDRVLADDVRSRPERDERMQVKGVLFDIDGTLFDFAAAEEAGLLGQLHAQAMFDRFPDAATALAVWHEIMRAQFARFLSGELTFAAQQRERVKAFLSHLGQRDVPDEQAAAWFAGYEAYRNAAWAAFPDAEPAVRKLATRYRLGIVSNSATDHQRQKLRAIGLLPYFDGALTCADSHGSSKPDPSIFLVGCASLGLESSEVAYVGDNYAHDAEGADDAGLRAYWLDRDHKCQAREVRHGIRVIHSLSELVDEEGYFVASP